MDKNYKPITSMKEVPEQLRKLRRQYLRYQQAEIIYSISHKKLFELASDAGALYRIDGTVLIKALTCSELMPLHYMLERKEFYGKSKTATLCAENVFKEIWLWKYRR